MFTFTPWRRRTTLLNKERIQMKIWKKKLYISWISKPGMDLGFSIFLGGGELSEKKINKHLYSNNKVSTKI